MSDNEKEPEIKFETIVIPSRINNSQFGANAKIFEQHIKGKPLEVITRSPDGQFIEVKIAHGDTYMLHISDLLTDTVYQALKAAQEIAFKDKNEQEYNEIQKKLHGYKGNVNL